jgi:hypothetical protein
LIDRNIVSELPGAPSAELQGGALQHLQDGEALLRRLYLFFIDLPLDQLDTQSKLGGDRRFRMVPLTQNPKIQPAIS